MKSPLLQKQVFSWALYDWANSAFATTVMVVFFPLFNKQFLAPDQAATTSTIILAYGSGASSFNPSASRMAKSGDSSPESIS